MSEPTLREALGAAVNDALYGESGWRLTQDELDAVLRAVASQPVTDAATITRLLCDEGWEGRWHPLDYANMRPLAQHTAEVLVAALEAARAARTETSK